MTDLPFEKRSRQSLFVGLSLIAVGFLAYYTSLKTDADLISQMPDAIHIGATSALISNDADKPCDRFRPSWTAIVNRASEKNSARQAAELTARSFADLAGEAKQTDEIKYKCLLATVQATSAADRNLRDGVLLRKMRKVTADQLALVAPDQDAQVNAQVLLDRVAVETVKIEDMKSQIKSAQILKGMMIRQKEKGVYEITDSQGRPGILQTSKTFFQRKGPFSISARNTKQIDVKLSEAEGGFDTQRLVWEEMTSLKDLNKNIANSRAAIVVLKKAIAKNDLRDQLSNKHRLAQMKKAFEYIIAEYDGLTGRSVQEMSAN